MRIENGIRKSVVFLIASLVAVPAAVAVPVSVTGGFTSFSSSGVFGTSPGQSSTLNGGPLCPDSGCTTTIGPASVSFPTTSSVVFFNSTPTPNALNEVSFTPAPAQEVNGTGPANAFFLGTLLFTNGIWSAFDVSFGFTLTTVSSLPAFDGQTATETLFMQVTANSASNTPAQNADFVYFLGTPGIGSIRAYERADSPTGTNTVSAKLFGYIDSLHLSAFTDATGGFFDPGVALEPTPTGLAEPGTAALLSVALCAFGFARRYL